MGSRCSFGVGWYRAGGGGGGVRRNEKLHGPLAAKNRTEFSFTQIAK